MAKQKDAAEMLTENIETACMQLDELMGVIMRLSSTPGRAAVRKHYDSHADESIGSWFLGGCEAIWTLMDARDSGEVN